jgi:2-polyprenyl-3-methyl-5-hydroxy-6-metoxy-1,4-benzoquinol methylase
MGGDHIIEQYERHAETWVQARVRERSFPEKGWLDRFCALVPSHANILDCGCGAGEPIATYLTAQGLAVTGIDSSETMVRMFRDRLPDQRALVQDMRKLSLAETFDGILAWDSFFHLNHDDQRQMFSVFRAHAKPGAALMFTSGSSHGEAIGVFQGEPLYHASLDPAEYRTLLEDHGFHVAAHVFEDQNCGGRAVWLALSRQRSTD